MLISLHHIPTCGSTNSEILEFIQENPCGTAVYTFCQTAGRGQYGNRWQSLPGENLAYSLAVEANLLRTSANLFNYHTATVVRDFIAKVTDCGAEIKWPNDIILKKKKICGILIEKHKSENLREYFIIGIGINILSDEFSELPKAGSLFTQTGLRPDLHMFTEEFHQYISENIFPQKGDEEILEKFNGHLFRKDEVSVFEIEKVRQNGIVRKADAEGFLWVELENGGLRKFYHKEMELLY